MALRALAERVDLRRIGDHVIEFDEVPRNLAVGVDCQLAACSRAGHATANDVRRSPRPWRVGMFCTLELNSGCDGPSCRR